MFRTAWAVAGIILCAGFMAQPVLAADNVVEITNGLLTVRYNRDAEAFTVLRGGAAVAKGERFSGASGIEVKKVEVSGPFGKGQAIEEKDNAGMTVILSLYPDLPFLCLDTTVQNAWDQPFDVNELEPVSITPLLGAPGKDIKVVACDGLSTGADAKIAYTFMAMTNPATKAGAVFGWLTQERGPGIVQLEPEDDAFSIVGETTYNGKLKVAPGATVKGETFAAGFFDNPLDGLDAYGAALAKANNITLPPVISGYCTWYHAGALQEAGMKKLADFSQTEMAPFGLNFLQIDDGWQIGKRDYTTHNPKGPYASGMKPTADAITGAGFRAGLWLIPFGWDRRDKPFEGHQDWFVHRDDGQVYAVEWAGDCLDMSHPDARAFLKEVISRITQEWGYRYLKIDGLWSGMAVKLLYPEPTYREDGLGDAVFHDPNKTNVEVYRDGLRLVREAAGPDVFLLGCTAAQNMRTLGASIGLVDGMRIGRDIGTEWGAILPNAEMGARLYFMHGSVWYNDPDCLLVRPPLTVDQARAWASWIAVSGQFNAVSEWLPSLPPDRLDIVKRTLPNPGRRGRPLDLFASSNPRVWHMPVEQAGQHWDVIGLFNWDAKPAEFTVNPAEFLPAGSPTGPWVAYEYWSNALLGPFEGETKITVARQSCQVLAVRVAGDTPQLVSTSRHITQGAVDLTALEWQDAARVMAGRSLLIPKDAYELRFRLPEGWRVASAEATGATAEVVQADGPCARVKLAADQVGEAGWKVTFTAP